MVANSMGVSFSIGITFDVSTLMDTGRTVDSVSETRSRTMRAVKSRGNASTEGVVVKLLRTAGLSGWRRHLNKPGRPDFAWPKQKVALFVDGCFWHGCPVCNRTMPVTNADYWAAKVARNVARDRRISRELRRIGWSVLRVWEHALDRPGPLLARLRRALGVPSDPH